MRPAASYVYHYNAQSGSACLNGILRLEKPIYSQEDYVRIKDLLSDKFNVKRDTLIISSLSFLGGDHLTPHQR